MHRFAWAAALAVGGLLGGFFFVFQPTFADGPANALHWEYLVAYGLALAAFGLLSWVGVRFSDWGLRALAWVGVPAVFVLTVLRLPPNLVTLYVVTATLLGMAAGAYVGHKVAKPTA